MADAIVDCHRVLNAGVVERRCERFHLADGDLVDPRPQRCPTRAAPAPAPVTAAGSVTVDHRKAPPPSARRRSAAPTARIVHPQNRNRPKPHALDQRHPTRVNRPARLSASAQWADRASVRRIHKRAGHSGRYPSPVDIRGEDNVALGGEGICNVGQFSVQPTIRVARAGRDALLRLQAGPGNPGV